MLPTQTPTRKRDEFDPNRVFTALKAGKYAKKPYKIGEVITKADFTPRQLRNMYTSRWVKMMPLSATPVEAYPPDLINRPDFTTLTIPEIKLWLTTHGAQFGGRASRESLLHIADTKWKEIVASKAKVDA